MGFQVEKVNDVLVVDVEGQLIVGNRQELKQKVLEELENGERKFIVDFEKTGYIDSSGLGVLVSLSKKVREQGGTDFGFGFGEAARFRVSVFKQKGNVGIVLRQIPWKNLSKSS